MATPAQLETVARHFIIAAVWADCNEGTHPKIPAATKRAALDICTRFVAAHSALFDEAMQRASDGYGAHPDAGSPEAAFGHDLWLTLCRHGVGFWDRRELKTDGLGKRLTDACHAFGEPQFEQYRGWFYIYEMGAGV